MSQWDKQNTTAAPAADLNDATDYRIREAEARLARRLESVEARAARMTWTAWASAMGFFLTLVALAWVARVALPGDGAWSVTSMSAEEIVLRDVDGVARGLMTTDSDGQVHLALSDRDGRERIRLTVLGDGSPGVTISDRDANPRAVLGYLPDGTTNLVFADAQGVSRAVVGLDADGSAQALFADRSGAIRSLIGVGIDGVPAVSTFEAVADGSQQNP